jgi:hypothetical protein
VTSVVAPEAAAASSTISVPRMFVMSERSGSSMISFTPTAAARWTTTSAEEASRVTSA